MHIEQNVPPKTVALTPSCQIKVILFELFVYIFSVGTKTKSIYYVNTYLVYLTMFKKAIQNVFVTI